MNDMKDTNTNARAREKVMAMIRAGRVRMKPRWQFILLSVLYALGALLLLLVLLYAASLCVFLLRASGAWFAPSFGGRGWIEFLRSLPFVLLIIIVLFAVVLEILVRRYSFVYRFPLLASFGSIVIFTLLGGIVIAHTSLHRQLAFYARHHEIPLSLGMVYQSPFKVVPPSDVYHGTIITLFSDGFTMRDDRTGTSTIIITAKTQLPYGGNFTTGERVVVIGDKNVNGAVDAFGVRGVDE